MVKNVLAVQNNRHDDDRALRLGVRYRFYAMFQSVLPRTHHWACITNGETDDPHREQ
jgi:hypothetical protein